MNIVDRFVLSARVCLSCQVLDFKTVNIFAICKEISKI